MVCVLAALPRSTAVTVSVVTNTIHRDTIIYNVKHVKKIIAKDTLYQFGFKYNDKYIDIGCTTYWSAKGNSHYILRYDIVPDTIKHIVMLWRGIPTSITTVNGMQYQPVITQDGISALLNEQRLEWDRAWVGSVFAVLVMSGLILVIK